MAQKKEPVFGFLQKQQRISVVQQVIDALTNAMISGDLKPGDKIPTENELSSSLGIARNSVREAIKMLSFMGVLEIRRPEGTFVCEGFSDAMINPMLYGIILSGNDSGNDIMELREMIEVGLINLAMDKLTDENISNLKELLLDLKERCLEDPPDMEKVFAADNAFHDAIEKIANNSMVSKINSIARSLTHSMRYEAGAELVMAGMGYDFYEVHENIFNHLVSRKRENTNFVIRSSYGLKD